MIVYGRDLINERKFNKLSMINLYLYIYFFFSIPKVVSFVGLKV